MSEVSFITQPSARTTLDAIEAIAKASDLTKLDIAVAYLTSSGTYDFLARINAALGADWVGVKKRWITSFDYCRTQPIALETLLALPSSSVRVYDAPFCLANGGMPKIPFHPKAFLFRGKEKDFALAGSGNLSRSGLTKGVEVGLTLSVNRKNPVEPTSAESMKALRGWYKAIWATATPLDAALLERYRKVFERTPNLLSPTPTDDDVLTDTMNRQALSGNDLRKMRVCRHFWIKMGNNPNRGGHAPSSQIMMKRLSRVFFGFPPDDLAKDTFIGDIDISYAGGPSNPYSIYFSNNKMDKLNLPMPGTFGPAAYEDEYLLFTQTGLKSFNLKIGSQLERKSWLKKSKEIEASYEMASGGREWGVF